MEGSSFRDTHLISSHGVIRRRTDAIRIRIKSPTKTRLCRNIACVCDRTSNSSPLYAEPRLTRPHATKGENKALSGSMFDGVQVCDKLRKGSVIRSLSWLNDEDNGFSRASALMHYYLKKASDR